MEYFTWTEWTNYSLVYLINWLITSLVTDYIHDHFTAVVQVNRVCTKTQTVSNGYAV